MSQNTSIEWTDATWNPVRGCSRVSEGCRNCYAERQAARFVFQNVAGEGGELQKPGPFHGFVTHVNGHAAWTGKVELVEHHLLDPLKWKKPRRVFVNSMSDLFHEALPDEAIDRVFAVMAVATTHTFQVLTKRPKRMLEYISTTRMLNVDGTLAPPQILPNVWLGVSVEDQKTADERIPLLLQTPAAIRFVSYEPALGPVDFSAHKIPALFGPNKLHWVIVGGESGPGSRPFDVAWARNTIAQCKAAGVACFVKQLGRYPNGDGFPADFDYRKRDLKGGDWSEWPKDLRVRKFPNISGKGRIGA